jgi:catechol 2,3-dioxygenase-like lactoylglutathione lyase family enzyme
MDAPPPTMDPAVFDAPLRRQLDAFLDDHRQLLLDCLDGLSEEQARRRLVPSRTTLLSLVKHATFVEKVWFDEAVTGRPRDEIGIPESQSDSFDLDDDDSVASVRAAYLAACDDSRRATAALGLDDVLTGNRRGPLPLRWVMLHMLRELAQHCGHAQILREQVLAADTPPFVRATSVTVMTPDPLLLADFYARLLGVEVTATEPPPPDGPAADAFAQIRMPHLTLNFEYEVQWTRPVWPAEAGHQSATQHLDLWVGDLEASSAWATECGATLADTQPQDDVRVFLDPSGHPFCLFV